MNIFGSWCHKPYALVLMGKANSRTQKCTKTRTPGWVRSMGQVTPSPHNWVNSDVVYRRSFASEIRPYFSMFHVFSFITSCCMVKVLQDYRCSAGIPFLPPKALSLSHLFTPNLLLSVLLQSNLSLCTLQTGDACAFIMLSKEEVQE